MKVFFRMTTKFFAKFHFQFNKSHQYEKTLAVVLISKDHSKFLDSKKISLEGEKWTKNWFFMSCLKIKGNWFSKNSSGFFEFSEFTILNPVVRIYFEWRKRENKKKWIQIFQWWPRPPYNNQKTSLSKEIFYSIYEYPVLNAFKSYLWRPRRESYFIGLMLSFE